MTHRSDAEPAIRVEALRVVRGDRTVLPGLTLAVPRGQLIGLLGPSGCGKTTLMRSIVGVQQVAGGTVEVLGEPAGSEGLRRRVGYLTQDASVYLDLTITENLRYFATVVGVPRHGVDAEVLRVLGLVDLVEHASSRAGNLSGGELSRVSLAAALVGKPEVLVLDEPTVGLVLQGEIYTGDGICAGHGWCAASGDRSGWPLSGGGRQMPEFRGLSGRMGAVLARPSDFDSIGSTLAIFRLAGNGVGIVGCCRRQRIMDVKCDVADRRAFLIVGPGWCGISAWN